MSLYEKCTTKPYSFLVIDATLASDNPSRFRKNLLVRMWKLIMKINDKIRDKKQQYDIDKSLQKFQHFHQEKLRNTNISQLKKHYLLIEAKLIEQVYIFSFKRSFVKPSWCFKLSNLSNETDELKQIEVAFSNFYDWND